MIIDVRPRCIFALLMLNSHLFAMLTVLTLAAGCSQSPSEPLEPRHTSQPDNRKIASMGMAVDLPPGYELITRERHEELLEAPFNPAADAYQSENRFSSGFIKEVDAVHDLLLDHFSQYGEPASLDRYDNDLPSAFHIPSDVYSNSRFMFVDLLNVRLQRIEVIAGLQERLHELGNDWIVLLGHDNEYDEYGRFVDEPGEFQIWVSKNQVLVFAERPEDIQVLVDSLPG